MTNQQLVEQWLIRAKSNLERAKAGKVAEYQEALEIACKVSAWVVGQVREG